MNEEVMGTRLTHFCRTWATRLLALGVAALPPIPALAVVVPSEVEPSRIAPGITGPAEPNLNAPGEALPVLPENVEIPVAP
jgi:hypothetical protein